MVLFFMSLYLTKVLGYDTDTAGIILMIFGAGSFVGSYLGGWLSDKIGPEKVQFFSLLFSGFGFIYLGTIDNIYLLGVTFFIVSIISESFRPANISMIAEVCPPALRTRGFSLNRLAINLGVSIGPAVGGVLALYSYYYLFLVDGITCIAASVMFWFLFLRKQTKKFKTENVEVTEVKSPLKDGIFILFLSLLFLLGVMFNQVFNTWPLYLKDVYLLSEDKIGFLLGANALMCVIIEMPVIHRFGDRKQLRVMLFGSLMLTLGFVILPLGSGFYFVLFTVFIWTIGEILVFPLSSNFVSNRADDRSRGKYFGFYAITFSTAFMLGPLFGTSVIKYLGYEYLWYIIGLFGIYEIAGFLLLSKLIAKEKRSAVKPA